MRSLLIFIFVSASASFARAEAFQNQYVPLPISSFSVSFQCNESDVDLTSWKIEGLTPGFNSLDVIFNGHAAPSTTDNQFIVKSNGTLDLLTSKGGPEIEIGHFNIGAASCDPPDSAGGYDQHWEASELQVALDKGIKLFIKPGKFACKSDRSTGPYPLNVLVVKSAGGFIDRLQTTVCE